MDELTIPSHLAIPSLICIVGLLIIIAKRKFLFLKNRLLWTSISIFLCLYLLIVGTATYDDIYYQWNLNHYDLDNNGIFSGKELTKEQNEAMTKLTNDTGRNFSFITGFIFSFIISLTIFILGRILNGIRRKV